MKTQPIILHRLLVTFHMEQYTHYFLVATRDGNFMDDIMIFPIDDIPQYILKSIENIKTITNDGRHLYYYIENGEYFDESHNIINQDIVEDIKSVGKLTYAWRPAFADIFRTSDGIFPKYVEESMYISKFVNIQDVPEMLNKVVTFYNEDLIIDDMIYLRWL